MQNLQQLNVPSSFCLSNHLTYLTKFMNVHILMFLFKPGICISHLCKVQCRLHNLGTSLVAQVGSF